ncbi:uncharacterized protein ACN2A1_014303 [Glossina fuscipes fuscipes]
MRTFISFFLYSCLFSSFIGLSKNQCTLNFPKNVLLRPQIMKFSGPRVTNIVHCPSNGTIELEDAEYVIATCYLFDVDLFYNVSRMTLQCTNDKVIEKLSGRPMDSIELKCIMPPFNMYRSSTVDNGYYEILPWCPRSSLFFINASTDSTTPEVFTGVICYDTRLSSVKTIYYEYVPWRDREILAPTVPATYIGEEFDSAVPKDQNLILPLHYKNEEFRQWFNFGQFEYASSLPQSVSAKLREELSSLFNNMWWPYLRLGNWKRYEDKLLEYVEKSGRVQILSGTFGEVRVPVNETGRYDQFVMSVLEDDSGRTIPEYIWNDLKWNQEGEKHVVIFGFNSPFYEFFSENDIVFCRSMCEEIEWLRDIQKTFKYPNMGVMFCCLHEDVVKLNLIEGLGKTMLFPPDFEKPKGCPSSDEDDSSEDNDSDESVESLSVRDGRGSGRDKSYEHDSERDYVKSGKRSHHDKGCHEFRSGNHPHQRDHHYRDSDESYEDSRERNHLDNESAESTECSCERTQRHRHCVESTKKSHRSDHHGKSYHKFHQRSCRSGNHPHRRNHHRKHSYEDSRERNLSDNESDESTECSCELAYRSNGCDGPNHVGHESRQRDQYDTYCAQSGKKSHRRGRHGKRSHKFHRDISRSGNHPHRRDHHCTSSDESYEDSDSKDQHKRNSHESGESSRERKHHSRNSDVSYEDSSTEDHRHHRNGHESWEGNLHGRNSDESDEDSRESNHDGRNSDESYEDSREEDQHNGNSDESYDDSRERRQYANDWDDWRELNKHSRNSHDHQLHTNSHRRNHHGRDNGESYAKLGQDD